ncbi:cytoplasmic polyadenylation element-binding protein 2 [Plakobranchus ocellatus]|uniref:Cytoplasmic polyadenylation element-binding protein 2 n=1 Tax=Plakobranchus ocellatus TaxID=259542 RepID=A0AAV3YD90_9GAST|nr:cytoplasmic polyadenylation element-binding protein 2 [Plakobranchus ocellatus]
MQDVSHCENAALRQMIQDQITMTSSNGKINDTVSAVQPETVESSSDQINVDERLKNCSVPTSLQVSTNEALNMSSGAQTINQNMLWSGTSTSAVASVPDENYIQNISSVNNGELTFQQFQTSAAVNVNRPIYHSSFPSNHAAGTFSQGRRAITGHSTITNFPRQPASFMVNTCNNPKVMPQWNNSQLMSWPTQQPQAPLYPPWNMQQPHRSASNLNPVGPGVLKKQNVQQHLPQQAYVTPSKYKRNIPVSGQLSGVSVAKSPYDFSALEEAVKLPNSASYDLGKFPAMENQYIDVMKKTHMDGPQEMAGKLPYMLEDSTLVDDGSLDQTVPNLAATPGSSPTSQGIDRIERFSRKVFVGGLPPDIDEEEITTAFRRFGGLVVDWPHKAESKSYFPPKGYCFLIFQDELSVQSLIESCLMDEDKLYWCVSSPTMKDKPVQIRPWSLSDSDFVMDGSQPLDPRKTIFVGGVPRPLRAVELAMIMDRLYGGVCYAGIDTDPELKYPKGAGRVAFSNQQSYIAAISARFVQLQYGDIDKRVEVKPYVLDDQMCDECHGARCASKFAPFFCANVTCLQYYCEHCWAQIHSRPGREYHKPLVKEGADRPRAVPFRWC